MTEYEEFKYEPDPRTGGWKLTYPHGQTFITPVQTEQVLRASIDELHRRMEEGTHGT